MKKIAILTYNRVGDGQFDNGILRRENKEIYIAQNGHKAKWAANSGTDYEKEETRSRAAQQAINQVDLTDMDHTYLYVGAGGGEEAIRQTRNIHGEKITYVMCGCNWGTKRRMIRELGNADAEIADCECGGRRTLEKILGTLLAE